MFSLRRRRLFVDRRIQGALLLHTTLYWFYCLIAITVIAIGWIVIADAPRSSADLFSRLSKNFGPPLVGAILLLPIVLLDCLRLSHRFAGPMIRIQNAMNQLAKGKNPGRINLRDGDFWSAFADDVNCLIDQRAQAADGRPVSASPLVEKDSSDIHTPSGTPTPCSPTSCAVEKVDTASIYSDMSA